jgi:hypothetical protein
VRTQARADGRAAASLAAKELGPLEGAAAQAGDVGEVDRDRLGPVGCHQANHDAVRELAGPVPVELPGDGAGGPLGDKGCCCLAERVLVDGEQALVERVYVSSLARLSVEGDGVLLMPR